MFTFILTPFRIIKTVIQEIYKHYNELIDKRSPKRLNAAINIFSVLCFIICLFIFSIASVVSSKTYVAEISILTGALTALCGYNYTVAKKNPNRANEDLNSDTKEN